MAHKVLIVDDVPAVYEALSRALHHEPYELLYAESAQKGLQLLRRNVISVVISDQDMPGMLGVDFLKQVHEQQPATTRMMLTGKATLEVAVDAINEGAVERFFMKPAQPIEIALAIRQALKQRDLLVRVHRLMRRRKVEQEALGKLAKDQSSVAKALRDARGQEIIDEPVTLDDVLDELKMDSGEAV